MIGSAAKLGAAALLLTLGLATAARAANFGSSTPVPSDQAPPVLASRAVGSTAGADGPQSLELVAPRTYAVVADRRSYGKSKSPTKTFYTVSYGQFASSPAACQCGFSLATRDHTNLRIQITSGNTTTSVFITAIPRESKVENPNDTFLVECSNSDSFVPWGQFASWDKAVAEVATLLDTMPSAIRITRCAPSPK